MQGDVVSQHNLHIGFFFQRGRGFIRISVPSRVQQRCSAREQYMLLQLLLQLCVKDSPLALTPWCIPLSMAQRSTIRMHRAILSSRAVSKLVLAQRTLLESEFNSNYCTLLLEYQQTLTFEEFHLPVKDLTTSNSTIYFLLDSSTVSIGTTWKVAISFGISISVGRSGK